MSESIYKNDELENEMTLDMSYFWYSDVAVAREVISKVISFSSSSFLYIDSDISLYYIFLLVILIF